MPSNFLGTGATVDAWLADPASNNVYAVAGQLTGFLPVTKPSGQADTQATGLVSFGKDPNDTTEIGRGVGVYTSIYCTAAAAFGTASVSNCGLTAALALDAAPASTLLENPVPNALEVNWALPYDIPGDRTEAVIICKTEMHTSDGACAVGNTADAC